MAQQQQRSRLQSTDDLDVIVDMDAHVGQPLTAYGPYLDEPYRSLTSDENGSFEDSYWSSPDAELFRTVGGKVFTNSVVTVEDVREAMDTLDIDYFMLTPSTVAALPIYSDDRFAHAIARAVNNRMLEEFIDEDDRFKGVVSLTPHQPDLAAEEIHRVGSHPDIVAAYMGSVGIFPALGNRQYFPMYEALIEEDLPLLLHGATGMYIGAHPWIKRALDSYWELHIVSHPFSQVINLTSLLGQGIPERYPELTFVFEEAGIEWIPMAMFRMDNEYGMRRSEVPMLEKPPSEYITDPDGPFYFTSQPMGEPHQSEHLANIIRMFNGGENLMFASDFPHYDFDTPEELFNLINPHLEEQEVRNIFGETAVELFDLH